MVAPWKLNNTIEETKDREDIVKKASMEVLGDQVTRSQKSTILLKILLGM